MRLLQPIPVLSKRRAGQPKRSLAFLLLTADDRYGPEGDRHGWRSRPPEAGCRVWLPLGLCPVAMVALHLGKGVSFGYLFFEPFQRKVTRARQRTKAVAVASRATDKDKKGRWIPAFAGMTSKGEHQSHSQSDLRDAEVAKIVAASSNLITEC